MKLILIAIFFFVFALNIDLEERSLLDNRIEILIPKDFKEMSQELINLKYPGKNRPKLILTDESGTINIAFSISDIKVDSNEIEVYEEAIKSSYKKNFPNAVWKKDGITRINGKRIGYLKLITDAKDQKMYNYIFITDIKGKLLMGTFNCTLKSLSEWEATSEKIVSSLKIN